MKWKTWELNEFSYVIWSSFVVVLLEVQSLTTRGANTTVMKNGVLNPKCAWISRIWISVNSDRSSSVRLNVFVKGKSPVYGKSQAKVGEVAEGWFSV